MMALSVRAIYIRHIRAVLLSSALWGGTSLDAFAQSPGAQPGNKIQDYAPVTGILWNLALKPQGIAAFDKDGNIANAGPVSFACRGQSIELIDGLVKDGWLETKKFGRIHIQLKPQQELLVSASQYDQFIRTCSSK